MIITMRRTTTPRRLFAPSARISTPASPRSYRKTSRRKGCATCKPSAGTPSPSSPKLYSGTREFSTISIKSTEHPPPFPPQAYKPFPLKTKTESNHLQPLIPLPLLQRRQRLPRPPNPLPLPPPHPPVLTPRPPRHPHPPTSPIPRRRRLRRRLQRTLPPRSIPTHIRLIHESRLCRLPRLLCLLLLLHHQQHKQQRRRQ